MREIKACSGVSASAKLRINLYFANVMIEFFRKMAGEWREKACAVGRKHVPLGESSKVGERGEIGKGRALKYDNPDKSYIWVIGFIRVIGFLCVIPYGYWCLLLACQSIVCFEKVSVILAFSRSSCTIAGAPI